MMAPLKISQICRKMYVKVFLSSSSSSLFLKSRFSMYNWAAVVKNLFRFNDINKPSVFKVTINLNTRFYSKFEVSLYFRE